MLSNINAIGVSTPQIIVLFCQHNSSVMFKCSFVKSIFSACSCQNHTKLFIIETHKVP